MQAFKNIHIFAVIGLVAGAPGGFAHQDLLGKRYCEIIYSQDYIDFYVYNTTGVNSCSHQWWKTLSEKKLSRDLSANYVFLNGPRVWLIDKSEGVGDAKQSKSFQGSQLPMVASFHNNFQSLLKRNGPFVDYEVKRSQRYYFNKGRTIFEVVNPEGKAYVLHSISLKHQQQSIHSLSQLAKHIHLPSGWAFKSGTLNKELVLQPKNHMIHVVMDELENTYQQSESDPLK